MIINDYISLYIKISIFALCANIFKNNRMSNLDFTAVEPRSDRGQTAVKPRLNWGWTGIGLSAVRNRSYFVFYLAYIWKLTCVFSFAPLSENFAHCKKVYTFLNFKIVRKMQALSFYASEKVITWHFTKFSATEIANNGKYMFSEHIAKFHYCDLHMEQHQLTQILFTIYSQYLRQVRNI